MPKLQILPGNIADMIAAGEVVQRPASVVKELMENAVDAGAGNINVIITDSGRTLIQVIDNGSGMSSSDAVLCFERHATSKIATAEDLSSIATFGFRGEALASIAAVAEVTLKTRRAEDELGTQVLVSASTVTSTSECATSVGANFAVRNLFYNVPARRKFLKSDNVEFKHIVEEFTRIAITRPQLGFSLSHNGRDIFVLKAAKSLKYRIADLLGNGVSSDIVDIHTRTSLLEVDGYIGRPDAARKTSSNQYFFVNGRYFRSAYLHKAVMKAYEEYAAPGLTPAYFIFIEIAPESVDVNIHPSKAEVKFEEDSLVFQVIYASVKETLGRNAFGASIDFDTDGSVNMPVIGEHFEELHPAGASSFTTAPVYNPFEGAAAEFDNASAEPKSYDYPRGGYMERAQNYGVLFEEKVLPTTQALILQGKYILSPTSSGLLLINIRRAWERILFERFLKTLDGSAHVSQNSLFPVQVRVGVENRLLFDEHATDLASLGFDISPFGADTIVVSAVPEGYSCEAAAVEKMVEDLTLILAEGTGTISAAVLNPLAEKLALLGSVSPAPVRNQTEAQHLMDALFACENSEYTSNGRKILTVVSTEELDKKF